MIPSRLFYGEWAIQEAYEGEVFVGHRERNGGGESAGICEG